MEALIYMAQEQPDFFGMQLLIGSTKGTRKGLPFAIASINITSMLLRLMRVNEEALAYVMARSFVAVTTQTMHEPADSRADFLLLLVSQKQSR